MFALDILNFSLDSLTVSVAVSIAALNIIIRFFKGSYPCISPQKCTIDILNGITIVPFISLFFCVFSVDLLSELQKSNMVLISVAGVVGVFFAGGEIFKNT